MRTVVEVLLAQSEIIERQQQIIEKLLTLLIQSDAVVDHLTLDEIRDVRASSEKVV